MKVPGCPQELRTPARVKYDIFLPLNYGQKRVTPDKSHPQLHKNNVSDENDELGAVSSTLRHAFVVF